MEGPTPVSALIHAATLVTAGVFLIIRCSSLFEKSQNALFILAIMGALTAFFAGTVGLVQSDLKRVIAFSTCSQLGLWYSPVDYLIIRWHYFISRITLYSKLYYF